jgi:hypothetical protein
MEVFMKKKASIEFETKGISCWVDDNIAVLKLSCSAFETIVNVEKDDSIMDWMDLVEASKDITGIMAVNDKDCFGDVAYANFLSEISGQKLSPDSPEPITKFENSQIRSIEINMLMNFIKKIMNFKKVFISALNGQVATPFFGLSLAKWGTAIFSAPLYWYKQSNRNAFKGWNNFSSRSRGTGSCK